MLQVWSTSYFQTAAVARVIFHLFWRFKMDDVRGMCVNKREGGKSIPNMAINWSTFVNGCFKHWVGPGCGNTQYHYSICSQCFKGWVGLATLLWIFYFNWTVLYCLSLMEKLIHKNATDHKSVRQWHEQIDLKVLKEKGTVNGRSCQMFLLAVEIIWQKAPSPKFPNKHHDLAWPVRRDSSTL